MKSSELPDGKMPPIGTAVDEIYTVILCPVCGNPTLDNRYVCPTCLWEYDGLPEDHYSAANGATLLEYRRAYLAKRRKKRPPPFQI